MAPRLAQAHESGMKMWRLADSNQSATEVTRSSPKKGFQACDYCKAKKVRCNGESPCTQCLDRGKNCTRTPRRKRQTATNETRGWSSNHQSTPPEINSFPEEVDSVRLLPSGNDVNDRLAPHLDEEESPLIVTMNNNAPESTQANPNPTSEQLMVSSLPNHHHSVSAHQHTLPTPSSNPGASPPAAHGDAQEDGSVCPSAEMSHSEYHGPRSFFSICSKPGIAWVTERTGISGFRQVAENLNRDVTSKLKLETKISNTRAQEPEPELAWKCVNAYFAEAQEVAFGVINRSWFEARLRAHYKDTNPVEDAAWYALRNVVFAYGHRFVFPDQTSFGKFEDTSWSWFENALSVHTELIFTRTSLIGVQALTIMAYYSEALSGTTIVYMLVATALHLAYSKGLHRQAAPSWGMTAELSHQRRRIFWAIYCLEKMIAGRSGRPSAINDDEITCQSPRLTSSDGYKNPAYCTLLVQICQNSSTILMRLNSAQAIRESPEEMLRTIVELDGQLRSMKASMEPIIDLDQLIIPSNLPSSFNLNQALDLQFAYFSVVFNLHSSLASPWSISSPRCRSDRNLQEELRKCSWTAAAAAKTAIMSTNLVRIDATSQISHTYSIPIHAVITLFVHAIQYLNDPQMKPELVLLDLAVGHFARLELIIGFKVHFARELSQFASCVEANRTSSQPSGGGQIISPSASAFSNGPVISGNEDNYAGNSGQQIDNMFGFQGEIDTLWDVDMWSTWMGDLGSGQ